MAEEATIYEFVAVARLADGEKLLGRQPKTGILAIIELAQIHAR